MAVEETTLPVEDQDTSVNLEDMEDDGFGVGDESQDEVDTTDEDSADESESLEDEEVPEADEEEESKDEPEEDAEEETEEEKPKDEASDEEKQKQHNREMAQKRLDAKAERQKNISEKQQEYLEQADPDNPQDLALRQLQVDAYNTRVEGNSNKLTNAYEKALQDFEIFRSDSPEIQAELDEAIDAFQAMNVSMDAYGNPTEIRADLYSYLAKKASSIEQLTNIGARKQEESKAKEKSKTMTTPSRTPKEPKKDLDLEAFMEEANRY